MKRKGMSLPSSYETGNPYVNLVIALIRQAMADEGTEYDNGFWSEFKETEVYKSGQRGNIDVLYLAVMIADYFWGK